MRFGIRTITLLFVALGLGFATGSAAHAQADAVASRPVQISAFGGASFVETGVGGGKNASLTLGVDFGLHSFFGLLPSVEGRGMFPVDDGSIDSQKVVLGGIKVVKPFGRIHPYIDFLFGRGQINCTVPTNNTAGPCFNHEMNYTKSPSNVWSPGAGVDLPMTPQLSLKLDVQLQQYTVKFNDSGEVYSMPITVGVVYHFGYGERHPK